MDTQDGLRKAKEAEAKGDIQGAFDTLRKTIKDATDVNFQGLARLPLRVESRPPGAKVTITLPTGEAVEAGLTPTQTFWYPYQGKTLVRVEAKGFEEKVLEREGIEKDTRAVEVVNLQRNIRWHREAGAAVEGQPGLTPGLVLVGTRGGLFRALSAESGDEKFQLRTEHLSGISGGILVSGSSAWFGGNDGEAFAVDLEKHDFRWRRKTQAPVSTTPVRCGGLAVFADTEGRLYAFKAESGDPAWTADLKCPTAGDILAVGDLILAGLSDDRLVAVKGSDGSTAWTAKLSGPPVGLAADGRGGVLAGTETSTVERVDLAKGTVGWVAKTDAPVHAKPVARPEGILAVSTQGTLFRLDASTGKESSPRATLGRSLEGGCAVSGNLLYAATSNGILVAWDIQGSRVLWQLSELGQLHGDPAVSAGILVIATADSAGSVVVVDP